MQAGSRLKTLTATVLVSSFAHADEPPLMMSFYAGSPSAQALAANELIDELTGVEIRSWLATAADRSVSWNESQLDSASTNIGKFNGVHAFYDSTYTIVNRGGQYTVESLFGFFDAPVIGAGLNPLKLFVVNSMNDYAADAIEDSREATDALVVGELTKLASTDRDRFSALLTQMTSVANSGDELGDSHADLAQSLDRILRDATTKPDGLTPDQEGLYATARAHLAIGMVGRVAQMVDQVRIIGEANDAEIRTRMDAYERDASDLRDRVSNAEAVLVGYARMESSLREMANAQGRLESAVADLRTDLASHAALTQQQITSSDRRLNYQGIALEGVARDVLLLQSDVGAISVTLFDSLSPDQQLKALGRDNFLTALLNAGVGEEQIKSRMARLEAWQSRQEFVDAANSVAKAAQGLQQASLALGLDPDDQERLSKGLYYLQTTAELAAAIGSKNYVQAAVIATKYLKDLDEPSPEQKRFEAIMSALAQIDGKLDAILDNQRAILANQVTIANSIQNLQRYVSRRLDSIDERLAGLAEDNEALGAGLRELLTQDMLVLQVFLQSRSTEFDAQYGTFESYAAMRSHYESAHTDRLWECVQTLRACMMDPDLSPDPFHAVMYAASYDDRGAAEAYRAFYKPLIASMVGCQSAVDDAPGPAGPVKALYDLSRHAPADTSTFRTMLLADIDLPRSQWLASDEADEYWYRVLHKPLSVAKVTTLAEYALAFAPYHDIIEREGAATLLDASSVFDHDEQTDAVRTGVRSRGQEMLLGAFRVVDACIAQQSIVVGPAPVHYMEETTRWMSVDSPTWTQRDLLHAQLMRHNSAFRVQALSYAIRRHLSANDSGTDRYRELYNAALKTATESPGTIPDLAGVVPPLWMLRVSEGVIEVAQQIEDQDAPEWHALPAPEWLATVASVRSRPLDKLISLRGRLAAELEARTYEQTETSSELLTAWLMEGAL